MKNLIKRWRNTSPLMEPVCRLLRATGILPRELWVHLAFTGVIDFQVAGRTVKMRHFGAEIENSLFWSGYGEGWEASTLLVWERLATTSATAFDVGANTGTFALAAKAANPAAKVHAFEPLPAIAKRLMDNILLNGFDIQTEIAAVSDHSGEATIHLMEAEHEYSATLEHMEWMDHARSVDVTVPLIQLAEYINACGAVPELIKIDVERHEPQALRGLWPAFNERPLPAIIIEILDEDVAQAIETEIAGRGYRTFNIREGVGLTERPLCAVPGTMNWLLLPREYPGEFAAALAGKSEMKNDQLLRDRPNRR